MLLPSTPTKSILVIPFFLFLSDSSVAFICFASSLSYIEFNLKYIYPIPINGIIISIEINATVIFFILFILSLP